MPTAAAPTPQKLPISTTALGVIVAKRLRTLGINVSKSGIRLLDASKDDKQIRT